MRIALVGQAPFCARVLERLAAAGEDIAGVFTPMGQRGDPVAEVADKLGVPLYRVASMKSPDVYAECSRLNPDLGVMAFVTDIVPERLLYCPRLQTIQYHPSLLPRHRGGSAVNWPIIQGETKSGITIFWPDGGIDTGPILMQKEVDISPDDTVGSLYFNKLFPLGVDSIVEAVDSVRRGTAPRIDQDESLATHEGLCGTGQARIDWEQSTRNTYNLIRGTNPQPGAHTRLAGKQTKVFDSEIRSGFASEKPGRVLEISAEGITVATADGAILIKKVQPESAAKMKASEYAQLLDLKVGAMCE